MPADALPTSISNANDSRPRSVLLAGATGLVGSECLRLLAAEPALSRVEVLVRRPLSPRQAPAGVAVRVVDFEQLPEHASYFAVDAIISALGTTMKKAGSRERFRRVDFEYPLAMAQLGLSQGAQHFLLVSAIGASAGSRFFYNRVKGELEDAVLALGYSAVTIVRPSLLLGSREEPRLGEEVAKRFTRMIPRRYRPVHARDVARVLVRAAMEGGSGTRIVESAEIPRSGRKSDE